MRLGNPVVPGYLKEEYGEAYVRALIRAFGIRFWPPELASPGLLPRDCVPIIQNLKTMASTRLSTCQSTDFVRFAKELEDMCGGLCLECVKEHSADVWDTYDMCEKDEH